MYSEEASLGNNKSRLNKRKKVLDMYKMKNKRHVGSMIQRNDEPKQYSARRGTRNQEWRYRRTIRRLYHLYKNHPNLRLRQSMNVLAD